MYNKKRNGGFTLIECLVALFIIAIVLASATRAIEQSINDVRMSYVREAATWVANNQISQYTLSKTYPQIQTTTETIHMAGVDFNVRTNVSTMPNPFFRKVIIEISQRQKPDYVLYKTITFVSQY